MDIMDRATRHISNRMEDEGIRLQIEAEFKTLETSFKVFSKKDPATLTDAEKHQIEELMSKAD